MEDADVVAPGNLSNIGPEAIGDGAAKNLDALCAKKECKSCLTDKSIAE
jgi:hypothetical protein